MLLGSNVKGLKSEFFSQGTKDCQHLRYESLINVDPKKIGITEHKIVTKRSQYFLTLNE